MAQELGPEARLPPVREMCELFSTSRVTLREALALLFTEQILYSKAREGIFVSPRIRHKSIAVLFDASIFTMRGLSPFWSSLWVLFTQEALRRQQFKEETCSFHHIMPTADFFHSLPEPIIQMFLEQRVHGVLAVGLGTPSSEWLLKQALPCISFAAGGHWIVKLDMAALTRQATQALVEQGCRRIGIWQQNLQRIIYEDITTYETFQGMKEVLEEKNMHLYPQFARILQLPLATNNPHKAMTFQEQGYQLAKDVFSRPPEERPDGLIICDEMLTDGALVAMQQMGIEPERDIKIATHANMYSPILFGHTARMLVFEFDPLELVQTMFSLLDMLMSGQKPTTRVINLLPRYAQ
ncbi:hypothetical protein KTT_10820 [Tengunoibacter tsumagoiensis]|uniref:HTH gntR-type domain-containing protein n=2 Tax=Tengunoibacter tsumagoiensis TaxID=2014871 RepID=A0A401ZWH1_9CHLR|nr:hypothetical protein KTT_10820 [Tengunoibacter tsumagoiensis]